MAQRFIKDSIWTSPNLNMLSDLAERHFYRLLPLPDDHGCCEVTPDVVKGLCYPKKPKINEVMIQKWNEELQHFDIIRMWGSNNRIFAYFPTWSEHQRIRACFKRKTPEPPTDVVSGRQVTSDGMTLLSSLSSSPLLSSLSTSPLPCKHGGGGLVGFEEFWKAFPKKKNKGQAERAWRSIAPDEQLQSKILAAIGRAKTSEQWAKEKGRFIPFPATWLNAKGWEDELLVDLPQEESWAEKKKKELAGAS